ncbi:MAG: TIGR04076 family protein [Erysipelotrichaceae bacterium]|nr:TIGR04076 family protein [Erysipelotrichaceae bacterium]
MKKVRITVIKRTFNEDVSENYGVKGLSLCELHQEGQVFVSNGWEKPEGLCESAWQCMSSFVFALSHGGRDFLKDWMKDKNTAVISCNDGCRPVVFLLEGTGEDSF